MYKPHVRCDKCGKALAECVVGNCKHPAVNQVFGTHICMYCCLGCKFHIRLTVEKDGMCGVQCGYIKERSN